MNKFFTKVAIASVGVAMAIGVGVAVSSARVGEVRADDVTDSITAANLTATNTTYNDFSGVSITSSAVYAGNSAKTSGGGIQMRSKNSNSGIVSTASGGTVKSVAITVESGTNTIDVYGSNSAYSAASDLYGDSKGTKVGSVSATGTVTFSDSYSYVGIRSNNGAIYLTNITIVWDNGGGGGGGEDPVLQSIAVSGEKTEYNIGDEFVKPTVTATYDKGDPQDVTESAIFAGYHMDVAGNYTVTVSYCGKTTTYDISVVDPTPVGEVLYTCDFTTVETHSYTQNKEFSLGDKNWVASVSQVNSSIFYLGTNTNASNAPKGVLNNNESFADVVTALSSEDSAYSTDVKTAHAYAMRFENQYSNVGKIQFNWNSTNNGFQVYLFGDHGDGLVLLSHKEAENSTSTPGFINWVASGYGEDFNSIVIVARPGAANSTATSKTIRPSTFTIYEGESASLIDTSIFDSLSEEGPFNVIIGNTTALWYKDISDSPYVTISGATWVSSDETVFASSGVYSGDEYFHGRGLKEGQVTLSASKSGYKVAEATVNVIPDPSLPEMEIWDNSGKVGENVAIYYSKTAGIYSFTARTVADTDIHVSDAVWESSDTSVATVVSNAGACSLTTLKPGEFDLTATSSSFQPATVHLSVTKGALEELTISGTPTKTSYTDAEESWSTAGLNVEAEYHSGWTEDVTSLVAWTYSPSVPAEGVTSLVYTATYDEVSANSSAFTVSVVHAHAGTSEDDPFTVAEAIAKAQEIGQTASGTWYTVGKISTITELSSEHGNATFNISDDGSPSNELVCYRGKYIDGASYTETTLSEIRLGRIVVVKGSLVNFKGTTPEYTTGYNLVSITDESTGDLDITFNPTANLELTDSGSFASDVIINSTATNPETTFSVEDSSILSVNSSTGAYEAKALGTTKVTVSVSADEGTGETSAFITVNGKYTQTVSDAIAIASGLDGSSDETTSYYIHVSGYVSQFDSDGKTRAFTISDHEESAEILVFVGAGVYSTFIEGLKLGDYIRMKANVQNYGGTYELKNPVKEDTMFTDLSFSFKLLELTDAVCTDYDGVTDNTEALESAWATLSSDDWFGALSDDYKSDLADADADEGGSTIEKAMARYDYLCGKYSLDNFIEGRTPVAFAHSGLSYNDANNNISLMVVIAITSFSIIGFTTLLVIKRRKHN